MVAMKMTLGDRTDWLLGQNRTEAIKFAKELGAVVVEIGDAATRLREDFLGMAVLNQL